MIELELLLGVFDSRLGPAEERISKLSDKSLTTHVVCEKDEPLYPLYPFCFILKGLIESTHNALTHIYI